MLRKLLEALMPARPSGDHPEHRDSLLVMILLTLLLNILLALTLVFSLDLEPPRRAPYTAVSVD